MSRLNFVPLIDTRTLPSQSSVSDMNDESRDNVKVKASKSTIFFTELVAKLKAHRVGIAILVVALSFIWQASYIHLKAMLAQYLLQDAFVHSSATHNQTPWPWADTWPVAKLNFPSLNEQQIVLATDSGSALAFGPGMNAMSVDFGEQGTIVIAGHRDTHFAVLQYLNPLEQITVELSDGRVLSYQITSISVKDINKDVLLQTEQSRLLLVTCYPFDGDSPDTPLRYVIEAIPV